MYKVTLYDECMPAFVSFTKSFFADDIEQFQQDWFLLERDEGTKERFLRSKSGEIVTDHYSDDPELNIVQRDDDAKVLAEYIVQREDVVIEPKNIYDYRHQVRVEHLDVMWRYILFHGKCHLVGRFHLQGACRLSENGCREQPCYGNNVLKFGWQDGPPEGGNTRSFAYYKNYVIASICWIDVCPYQGAPKELAEPEWGSEDYDRLFADILGECG